MPDWLDYATSGAGLALALVALIGWRAGRGPGAWEFTVGAVAEVVVLALAVTTWVSMAIGHRVSSPVEYVGYAIVTSLVIPAALWWGRLDRSRWGSLVVVVGGLVVAILAVRMHQVWAA